MNWLDVLLLLPLLVGLIRGLMRGLISEVIAIAAIILGIVGANVFGKPFATWILTQFGWPEAVCSIVSYVLLFLAITIALSLIGQGLTRLIKAIRLGWLNRILGGLFGMCKYGLIVLFIVFILDKTNEAFHWFEKAQVFKSSVVYPQMIRLERSIVFYANETAQP